MDNERILLTVEEAAKLTSLGRSRTYALVASGAIPSIKIGRSIRIPRLEFEAWVHDQIDRQLTPAAGQPAIEQEGMA